MNTKACMETLTGSGDIPVDARIVSTNNKVVIVSEAERVVARIGSLAELKLRDDPHDLRYSHQASWLAGAQAPVVKPLSEHPVLSEGYVISSYPLFRSDDMLDESRAQDTYDMTRSIGNALHVVVSGM